MFRSRILCLSLIAAGLGFALPAHAANLTVFLGKYGGKYTGVLVEASGATGRAVAGAGIKVRATPRNATFSIKGTLGETGYSQTIKLRGGKATISTLIPGGSGSLQSPALGTYKFRGKTAKLTFLNPGTLEGRMTVTISFVTGGSTLLISTVIENRGGNPIYTTIVGS